MEEQSPEFRVPEISESREEERRSLARLRAEAGNQRELEKENLEIRRTLETTQQERSDLEQQTRQLKFEVQELRARLADVQRAPDPGLAERELRELRQQITVRDERIGALTDKVQ